MGARLNRIAAEGNRRVNMSSTEWEPERNRIRCADGFSLSVIAGWGTYCEPRPDWFNGVPEDYAGPYTRVEVGFPSQRPEPWDAWQPFCESPAEPTETVYGYVPVEMVATLIDSHGGEA